MQEEVIYQEEFMGGFIQGARNIDFQSGNFENEIAALDKNATYAVYCRSGNRSGQACLMLEPYGFKNVINVTGGMLAWQEQFPG